MKEKDIEIKPTIPESVTSMEEYIRHQIDSYEVVLIKYEKDTEGTAQQLVDRGFNLNEVERNIQDLLATIKKLEHAQRFLKNGNEHRARRYIADRIEELNEQANRGFDVGNFEVMMTSIADMQVLKKLLE